LPDALFQAGLSYAKSDKRALARERMETLTSEAAYDSFSHRPDALIALTDYSLTAGDAKAALQSIGTYLSSRGEHHDVARAHLLKGKALYALKQYAEAISSLQESTKLTRSGIAAEAQFYVGQSLQIQSKFKEAVVAYLRVQALYGAEREWCGAAAFESAKCYEALGKADEATAVLKDVVAQYKDTQWAKLAEARLH